jgi:hypothetical protein
MNLLSGIGAASALIKNASDLVQAVKQPKVTDEAFSEILKAQLEASSSPEARKARAEEETARFMHQRDVDGDGSLRLSESGMERSVFERLDANRDGMLTSEEYKKALLGQTGAVS